MGEASTIQLGRVARLLSGGTPNKAQQEYWGGPIPWLTPKDMGRWNGSTEEMVSSDAIGNGTRLAPEGTIFIAVRGMSLHNEIRIIRSEAALAFNQDIKAIIPGEEIDGLFLYYALLAKKDELLSKVEAAGHGTGRLPTDRLKALTIPDIPSTDQRAIASMFDALDRKIELNRKMNETLEAMARTIFKSWFVDFEPVKAKAAGETRFRTMPQTVFDQLPAQLTQSEIGSIPETWTVVPIGDWVTIVGGSTPSTKKTEFWQGGVYCFCTPKDMSRLTSPVLLDTDRHITQAGVDQISSGQLPTGTTLLSSRAPIGYLAIAETPVSVNQGIIAMLAGEIPNAYILLWTAENMEVIKARAGGSTFAEISKSNFRSIPALRPDKQTLAGFGEIVQPMFEQITANERETGVLISVRDALLPKLISGQITVAGGEEMDHGS